ncbi:MAG: hypothetical protein AAF657_35180 [Acidobacteriota bacterium]
MSERTRASLGEGEATMAAVAYITDKGRSYYDLPAGSPPVVPFEMSLAWNAEELRYGSGKTITGIHRPYGEPVAFGSGRLFFFRYCTNPDQGSSHVPVNRISVLGLTSRGQFGFFREVDYTDYLRGSGQAPDQRGCEKDAGNDLPGTRDLSLQILSSSAGRFRHELVIEAGSPAALF